MNQQPIKRRNPFEVPKMVEEETTSQIQDEEEVLETNYEQPKVVTQTTSTIRTAQKQRGTSPFARRRDISCRGVC